MHLIWMLIQFVFWVVVIYSFLFVFLTHYILWFEYRLARLQGEGIPAMSLLLNLKSFVIEFCCVFAACLLFPLSFLPFTSKAYINNTDRPPILFVHGYLHNHTSWLMFIYQFCKKKVPNSLFVMTLNPPLASISVLANQVKEKVEAIRTQTGAKQIILVGHSMGGLVNSYFTEYLAKPGEVAKIITLGSPFKGSRLSALGSGQNSKEMCPDTLFLDELVSRIQKSQVPYFTIASRIDNIVVPWKSALLSDVSSPSHRQLILEDHGHLRLLISPITIAQVSEWVTQ